MDPCKKKSYIVIHASLVIKTVTGNGDRWV